MEDTNLNPISGEQVPFQDLSAKNQGVEAVMVQSSEPGKPKQANAKEFVIEKKMNTLKRSVFILGGILSILLIALIVVLALLAQKPEVGNEIRQTPLPVVSATPVENENIPREVVGRVKQMEEKINSLDIEENELSFPKVDWEIKY